MAFTLDTTSYDPFPIPDNDIEFVLGTPLVQEDTTYRVEVTSEVPLEIPDSGAGCYIKLEFPPELHLGTSLTYTVDSLLQGADGSTVGAPVEEVLTGDNKYVILPGCQNPDLRASQKVNAQTLIVTFDQIGNSFGVRETSVFTIGIYQDWSQLDGLTNKIIGSDTITVAADLYQTNAIPTVVVERIPFSPF